MLLVIFGAGASYDSSPTYAPGTAPVTGPGGVFDDYFRPPLAQDLFANRELFIRAIDLFPQCKPVVPKLRDASTVGKSVESVLQELEGQAETYARGRREMAAVRCYLQRAISECEANWQKVTGGITNYLTLLREIERLHKGQDPVCLVTFNYDTLIESALAHFGFELNHIESYVASQSIFRLFKLHGSVNWGQEVNINLPANLNPNSGFGVLRYLVENADGLATSTSDRFLMCDPANMGAANGRPVFPAIAVPVQQKSVFQCPRYMVEGLEKMLPQVRKIIVIGWRATEDHFLSLLKNRVPRGTFISVVAGGRSEADESLTRINVALRENPPSGIAEASGFTEFIRSGRAEEILKF